MPASNHCNFSRIIPNVTFAKTELPSNTFDFAALRVLRVCHGALCQTRTLQVQLGSSITFVYASAQR